MEVINRHIEICNYQLSYQEILEIISEEEKIQLRQGKLAIFRKFEEEWWILFGDEKREIHHERIEEV